MSTIKKHLTSDLNHKLPTYKKLPPISSPTSTKGSSLIKPVTVTKSGNQSAGTLHLEGKKIIITSTADAKKVITSHGSKRGSVDSKLVFKSTDPISLSSGKDSKNVELIGYKSTSTDVVETQAGSGTSGWTPLGSELPPCKICGDKASGLHYGVYTCEACKAFFRRTLKRANVDFQCTCTEEERKKGVDQPRKTTCPKCRYDRCIRVGMSKDAIKIGRYTINRKRQNDREVSMLKEQGKLAQSGSLNENSPGSTMSYSPYSSGQSVSSPEELSSNITNMSLQETSKDLAAPKKMRSNDYKGDGILFRSLTNSIFMSLIENKHNSTVPHGKGLNTGEVATADPPVSQMSEISPMEHLYMQPFQPSEGAAKPQVATPGVKFTPTQDQFSLLQKGGNSNPFSVTSKGGKVMQSVVVGPDIQGLAVPEMNSTFQFSPMQGSLSDSQSSTGSLTNQQVSANQQVSLPENLTNQNAAINDTITLTVVNQGGQLVAQNIAENENSQIELMLQQPSQISPLSTMLTTGQPNLATSAEKATYNSLESGISHDYDAVVPTIPNATLPSPLMEETSYDVDNIDLPIDELQREAILGTKLDPFLGLDNDIELVGVKNLGLAGENLDLQEGGGIHESFYDLDQQLEQFDLYQEPVLSPGKNISMEEINSIIASLESVARELELGMTKMTCQEIKERHKNYLEQYRLKMEVFGQMSNISREEYITFYNQTGIDIDNRQQIIIEGLKYLEDSIAKLVKFAKVIPGFSDLDIEDQVNLIKSCRFSQDLVKSGYGGNCVRCPGSEVTTTPWNKDYHIEELEKVFPKKFLQKKGEYVTEIYKMDLSMEEIAICRAVVITDPDQCQLKDHGSVERINNKMIACLCHLLAVRPANKKALNCKKVVEVLFSLRDISEMEHQVILEVFEMWPVSNNHTLLKEFIS